MTQAEKDNIQITRFVQTLSPDHLYKIPLMTRGLNLLLKSPEGTTVLRTLTPEIKLNIATNTNNLAGLTHQNIITLSSNEVTDNNRLGIALKTAHEITHTGAPQLPTRLLNGKPAFNLSLNQFLRLYKLNEINALITEMQICVDLGVNPETLPPAFQSYMQTFEKIYNQTQAPTPEQRRETTVLKTKACFFKAYLDPQSAAQIDPEFNELYEKRAIQFILDNNIHLSATDRASPQYDTCLNFYRQKCGSFLTTDELAVPCIASDNTTYQSLYEAVQMDAFFQEYRPQNNYTLQHIFNGIQQQNRLQKRYKPKKLKTRFTGRTRV